MGCDEAEQVNGTRLKAAVSLYRDREEMLAVTGGANLVRKLEDLVVGCLSGDG